MINQSKIIIGAMIINVLLMLPIGSYAYNPFATMADFNAIIFGNAQASGGDTEGRLAVGGNFYAESYSVGFSSSPDASKNSLVVGGDLNAKWQWQVANGNTKYGGNLTSSPSTVAPYTITKAANVVDFAGIQSQMLSTSSFLSTLSSNGTELYQYTTYTLTGLDPYLNVFNITDTNGWANASNRIISAPTGSTVIINVSGMSNFLKSSGMQLANGLDNTNVLFNYYQSTSLNINGISLLGSLLAPNAALTLNSGSVNGNAAVASSNQINGGEYHNYTFNGNVPVPVPEPSTLAACAMGLGMLPLLRRRRSHS